MVKLFDLEEDAHLPLHDKVFNALRDAIINGELEPGQSLVETKLAQEMGVSRTPIREAIRKLELEGLVRSIPNKGVVVRGISTQDIEDIYTIRKLLEGLAARWAAQRITDEELEKLEDLLGLMKFYADKDDMEQVNNRNTEFHEVIFKASKSQLLTQILSNLQEYLRRSRIASLKVPMRVQNAVSEHEGILEALKQRDPELAEARVVQHIANSNRNLLENKFKNGKFQL